MVAFKALIGGVIGAAIGCAFYNYINPHATPSIPWAAIVPGILAGLGVLILCGTERSKVTGLIALVATLGTLLVWPMVVAKLDDTVDASKLAKPYKATAKSTTDEPPQTPDTDAKDTDAKDTDAADPKTSEEDADKTGADADKEAATGDSEVADETTGDAKDSADINVTDKTDGDSKKDLNSSSKKLPDASSVKKAVPRAKTRVTPAMRNEGIAFFISGLLAYLIGTGSGDRKQEVNTQLRNV